MKTPRIDIAPVITFMAYGHPEAITYEVTFPQPEMVALAKKLIYDEVNKELLPAIEAENLIEIADGIADGLFVLIYTAFLYGLPITAIWDEVCRTNLAKFPDGTVLRDPDTQKILKPAGWQPPDIAGVLNCFISAAPMFCPHCNLQHIDHGEWASRPHRTHLCVDQPDADGKIQKGCGGKWTVLPLAYGA